MKIICDCRSTMENTERFNEQGLTIYNCVVCGKQVLVTDPLPGIHYEL